jgi:integrase
MGSRIRRRPGKKEGGKDTWELTVDLEPDPVSGRQRRRVVAFHGTKNEAKRALAKMEERIGSGSYVDPSRETVGSFLNRWLRDYVETNTAPKTRMYYQQVIRQHVIPRLGNKKLQLLRPVDVLEAQHYWLTEGWQRTKTHRGLSPKSVANMNGILHVAFKHAVEWRLLTTSPMDAVKPPQWERKEQAWLDLEQAQALVQHLEATPAGTAVLVKLSTGLRMGELLGLRWHDLDLAGGTIALQLQLQWLGGQGYVIRGVKSHRSRRPVSIDVELLDVLRAHRARQAETRQQSPVWQMSDMVFTNEIGAHLTPDQVRRALLHALAVAGLPRIRPHDLRHTHASVLLRLRTPMKVVQERLGHSTFAITADTYSHVGPDLQQQAAGVFGAALHGRRSAHSSPEAGSSSVS